uniref:Uncharacterized protein n=1 Tax=Anguilla anguilla TaxID=7936 RepID=A0A0E9RX95_ANGAN
MHIAAFICLLLNLPYMVQFRYIFLIVIISTLGYKSRKKHNHIPFFW